MKINRNAVLPVLGLIVLLAANPAVPATKQPIQQDNAEGVEKKQHVEELIGRI